MKWALVTLLIGYIAIWKYELVSPFIVPIGFVITLIFSTYLVSKRLKGLSTLGQKVKAIGWIVLFTGLITAIVYYSIKAEWISIWLYPPIFTTIVLLRGIFKKLINLTVSEPTSFGVMSETEQGETVRSKSEKKVADWLYHHDYLYEYERKIELPNGEYILTDFYLPNEDIYIEYWGMASADNETGEKYRNRKKEKIELYAQYGYKLISIYPYHLFELDNYIPSKIDELTSTGGIWNWLKSLFGMNTSKHESSVNLFCTNCGNQVTKIGEYCVKCGQLAE